MSIGRYIYKEKSLQMYVVLDTLAKVLIFFNKTGRMITPPTL